MYACYLLPLNFFYWQDFLLSPPFDLFYFFSTGGYEDRSALADAVKEVVKCLSSRAVRPSSLRLTLRMLELERVHAILSHQSLTSIAERMCMQAMTLYSLPSMFYLIITSFVILRIC